MKCVIQCRQFGILGRARLTPRQYEDSASDKQPPFSGGISTPQTSLVSASLSSPRRQTGNGQATSAGSPRPSSVRNQCFIVSVTVNNPYSVRIHIWLIFACA